MALAEKLENSFNSPQAELTILLKNKLELVDVTIDQTLQSDIPLIEQIAKHIIYAGGKRIRPLLTLATAQLFGKIPTEAIKLAAAVEFIHTATLLHDDVIDESDLRRGIPSAHKLWGNTTAILVGDFLFARAFELMVETNNLKVLKILSHTAAAIAAGEVLQLVETHNFTINQETALKILGAKTAELFGAACQTGALAAGANEEQALSLYEYGYGLGMIFQITDDILDYTAANADRGKAVGDDFREGKITLPVIFAYKSATDDERLFLKTAMVDGIQNDDDLKAAIVLINKYDGFGQSLALAQSFLDNATCSLSGEKGLDSTIQSLLLALAQSCLERQV